ncbi:hypothetical protein RRG08_020780 [Elysia crispata]|uniref:Uncharacterized protein n=1 Tax=Elysia crispata TaxID=231223 RepID=A0AAE1DM67_9GAST|nr:hypothetical protein RRG08_020780 [Elysia crispata]
MYSVDLEYKYKRTIIILIANDGISWNIWRLINVKGRYGKKASRERRTNAAPALRLKHQCSMQRTKISNTCIIRFLTVMGQL